MTDERLGERLFDAIAAMPRGSGIVFRHYSLPHRERMVLLKRVQRAAQRGRHTLSVGGKTHGRHRGALTAPVHSVRERIAAERAGVRLLFVSPVYATRSHPGGRPLGRIRFGLLIGPSRAKTVALGGMTARRARSLAAFGIHGWAAIDGLSDQKRKAVPT